jgi:hypothetical protein
MGRPINKRKFGATGVDATPTIPVRFKLGGTVYEGYIVKQRATRKFNVSTDDGTTATGACTLTDAVTPANNGDASLVGITTGGGAVTIKKLTNRVATDYNGNRYTYSLEDDSTETLIRLTAI